MSSSSSSRVVPEGNSKFSTRETADKLTTLSDKLTTLWACCFFGGISTVAFFAGILFAHGGDISSSFIATGCFIFALIFCYVGAKMVLEWEDTPLESALESACGTCTDKCPDCCCCDDCCGNLMTCLFSGGDD